MYRDNFLIDLLHVFCKFLHRVIVGKGHFDYSPFFRSDLPLTPAAALLNPATANSQNGTLTSHSTRKSPELPPPLRLDPPPLSKRLGKVMNVFSKNNWFNVQHLSMELCFLCFILDGFLCRFVILVDRRTFPPFMLRPLKYKLYIVPLVATEEFYRNFSCYVFSSLKAGY